MSDKLTRRLGPLLMAAGLLVLSGGAGEAFGQTSSSGAAAAPPSVRLEAPIELRPQLIKTIQRKNFLKVHRLELTPYVGGETIDPFVIHWEAGAALTYHLTEVFAVEGLLGFSPSLANTVGAVLGDPSEYESLDLRDLTLQLKSAGSWPRTSKIGAHGHAGLVFSPIYGKFALFDSRIVNFDVFFMSGLGFVRTRDLDLDKSGEPIEYTGITNQTHFATNFGFGFRGAFNKWMAFRLEGREYFFVESIVAGEDTMEELLNVKYYFFTQAGLSFFFPN